MLRATTLSWSFLVYGLCAAVIFPGGSSALPYLPDSRLSVDPAATAHLKPGRIVPKLETPLSELYINRNDRSKLASHIRGQLQRYLVADRVQVVLVLKDRRSAGAIERYVTASGGEIVAAFASRVEVLIPPALLKALAEKEEVLYIRLPLPVMEIDPGLEADAPAQLAATGNYVTQGVSASGAGLWHGRRFTGAGIKIGVLDYFELWETAQQQGELPPTIETVGTLGLFSPHGTAVAEIIYDMAPDAALTFASPFSATQMASLIVQLAQAGNRIISSSLTYMNEEPGDGTGTVSSAINIARDTYGSLYCQAAGNHAQVHWDGYFSDLDLDGYNDFAGDSQELNQLGYLAAGSLIFVNLRWSEWPVTDQDYDLHLYRWNGSSWELVTASANVQDGTQPPTEYIFITAPSSAYYGLAVVNNNAGGDQVLDLMGYRYPLQFNRKSRSLVDPATAAGSFSVAAIDGATYALESYSSRGPAHGPGGVLDGGLDQPRIAGFANVDTWSYGAGVFNGTSAATPHISGAAALVFQAFPWYTPDQTADFLEQQAIVQGATGYDYLFGAGRLNLGDAPYSVSVDQDGSGTGEIVSSPAGISCGQECTANFPAGSTVVLTASAGQGSRASWIDCQARGGTVSGNNTSQATCTFTGLVEDTSVAAVFSDFPWIIFGPAVSHPQP